MHSRFGGNGGGDDGVCGCALSIIAFPFKVLWFCVKVALVIVTLGALKNMFFDN